MSPGTAKTFRDRLATLKRRLENEETALAQADREAATIRDERDATAAEITDLERFLRAEGLQP